jgi:hypothetical protein
MDREGVGSLQFVLEAGKGDNCEYNLGRSDRKPSPILWEEI